MSDTETQEPARYTIRAYHETPEHAALAGAETAPREPISIAREQLGLAVREYGEVIDLDSIREDERVAVIVDEQGWEPAGDRTPTGHIITWSCTAHARVASDSGDPVLDPYEVEPGVHMAFVVPEPYASTGGAVRLRHNVGGSVTTYAKAADGTGVGYLLALDLDSNVQHVEFFGGTAYFVVEVD